MSVHRALLSTLETGGLMMSRGLGKWQRHLLTALDQYPAVFLADLLPPAYPRAQYAALHRAAQQLCERGKVDICHPERNAGSYGIWVMRPGYSCNRDQVPRLKVVGDELHRRVR
jgi:hypothetical protein